MKEADRQAVVEGAKRKLSRKGFLLGGAGVLGASAMIGAMPRMASAAPEEIDVLILNYALTLEHLEAQFYTVGVKKYARTFDKQTLKNLQRVRKHEDNHVAFLISVLGEINEEPVPRLRYNFSRTAFQSQQNFLETAALLENTGVSAYDGAIAHITDPGYVTAGSTIATVEARHATYIDSLIGAAPFPLPYDEPVAPRDVATIVRDTFVTSDPDASPYGPYDSYNDFLALLPDTTGPDQDGMNQMAELQEESTE